MQPRSGLSLSSLRIFLVNSTRLQQSFKGIWTKHVQFYLDNANNAARTAKYSSFLGSQSSAVIHFATGSSNVPGSVWYAPSSGGSVFTPETDSSGLAAHVAAAKVSYLVDWYIFTSIG
jgi:hypothetical protein